MASINKKVSSPVNTHEGAPARRISQVNELRRSVMACMLWEDSFYESGEDIALRISRLVSEIPDGNAVACVAIDARNKMKLRHVPLLVARELARKGYAVDKLLAEIIQRPDEITEFVSIYWKDGKEPLSKKVKQGLASVFKKFDEYALAKWNKDGAVKLRDVLFMVHAKPDNDDQAALWKKLVDGTLETPDTWEVSLSAGADKKESFTRLINENKLGALALLRNLRNMLESGISPDFIADAIRKMKTERVLPFRFIAASKFAPMLEPALEESMFKCISGHERLPGNTVVLVDVSDSMQDNISAKSDLTRLDAASALSMIAREIGNTRVFTFNNSISEIPARRGFALRDAIGRPYGGTELGKAVRFINENIPYDRLIVFTDEQSNDPVPNPKGRGYMINVASYKNGVGYGPWVHVDGFSEAIIDYIIEYEKAGE